MTAKRMLLPMRTLSIKVDEHGIPDDDRLTIEVDGIYKLELVRGPGNEGLVRVCIDEVMLGPDKVRRIDIALWPIEADVLTRWLARTL